MRLTVDLDDLTARRLIRRAVRDLRNVHWEAAILLRELLANDPDPLGEAKEENGEQGEARR